MVRREALAGGMAEIMELLRTRGRIAVDAEADLRPPPEPQVVVPDAVRTLGFLLALTALVSAGAVIGRGYAYSDVIALLAVQLVTVVIVWRVPWYRIDEAWLLVIVGIQTVYIAALITLTGGGQSPYFALYAPLLALAGWHLRRPHLFVALGFLGATELWRALAVERSAEFGHLTVSLPAFALVAVFANVLAARLRVSHAGSRRDQLRTAGALHAVRSIGDLPPDEPLSALTKEIGRAFDAEVGIGGVGIDDDGAAAHVCAEPDARYHLRLPMTCGNVTLGHIDHCRPDPFSSTERRLAAILADALGRAIESRRLFAQVRSEAERDHLTGLLNRRVFDRDLAAAVARAADAGEAVAVYFLDIDGFKAFNDAHGHANGDLALQTIALALSGQVRGRDRVYRFGGDEFVVIAMGLGGMKSIVMAERLRLASMSRLGVAQGYPLTISVGMSTSNGIGLTAERLLKEADAAMYREKRERRRRVAPD